MATSISESRCLHCGAQPTPSEALAGWCDSCGKKLPFSVQSEAQRQKGRPTSAIPAEEVGGNPPAASGRALLWGSLALAALVLSVVVIGVIAAFRMG